MLFVYDTWKKHKIIVVNGYDNYVFILLNLLNIFFFEKKVIAIESDTIITKINNPLKKIIKSIYLNFFFRRKYIYGLSGGNYRHKDLFKFYGMSKNRIFLMPLLVNNRKFSIDKKTSNKFFTFLFVGRLIKRKNVEELIIRFISGFKDKPSILKIVGSGSMLKYLKNKYISKQVLFLGKLKGKKLVKEYHSADVFVCPSYFEPWGLVVNEALSASLPAIVRKEVGSSDDLIRNNINGFIVNNDLEMIEKMIYLYNNPKIAKVFGKKSSFFINSKWNYELYVKCLYDFSKLKKNDVSF